ncbi:piggyBac transposable element-derived protein 3-like, partial [Silurus meridionalis]
DNTNVKQKGEPGYDPLFKVRPVLEKVRANCLKVEPEENHSIDEQMIPFKGKIGMKQYIKNKPHKWGIKVFTRAGVTGLVYDFEVYTGKGLYRRHLTQKQEKKYMPLLDFRVQVADALIKVGKQADLNSRKRGRPSLEDDPTSHQAAPPPPPLQRISAPSVDVRLDRCDHFPIHAEKRGRCRLCKNGYTQMACLKCKVLLCFTKDKNCFLEYHMT